MSENSTGGKSGATEFFSDEKFVYYEGIKREVNRS